MAVSSGKIALLTMLLSAAILTAAPAPAQEDLYSGTGPHILNRTKATKDQISKSAALFNEAMKTYKKDKKPADSIELFKKSILLFPNGVKYIELGNALMDAGEYEEAGRSYKSALRWEIADRHIALYNIACTSSLLNRVEDSLEYLEKAFRNHYSNFDHARKDPDLKNAGQSPKFLKLIAAYDNISKIPQALPGTWNDSPLLAERSPGSFSFAADGLFTYFFGSGDALKRNISYSGKWKIEGGKLTMTILERKDREGGRIIDDPAHPGQKSIMDYKEKTSKLSPLPEVTCSISNYITDDPFNTGTPLTRIQINGIPYWRWQAPESPKEKGKVPDKAVAADKKAAGKAVTPDKGARKDQGKAPLSDKIIQGKTVIPKKTAPADGKASLEKVIPADREAPKDKTAPPDKAKFQEKDGTNDSKTPGDKDQLDKTPAKDKVSAGGKSELQDKIKNDAATLPQKTLPDEKTVNKENKAAPDKTITSDSQVLKDNAAVSDKNTLKDKGTAQPAK